MSTVGAPLREEASSPTATGLPPLPCRLALPPAPITRSQIHSAACFKAAASPPPVDTDGMRRNSKSSSSNLSLTSTAFEVALELPVGHHVVVEDALFLTRGVQKVLEHEVTE